MGERPCLGEAWPVRSVCYGFPGTCGGFEWSSDGTAIVGRSDVDSGASPLTESRHDVAKRVLSAKCPGRSTAAYLKNLFGEPSEAHLVPCPECERSKGRRPQSCERCEDDGQIYAGGDPRDVLIQGECFDANLIACALANAFAEGFAAFGIVEENGGHMLVIRGVNWILAVMGKRPTIALSPGEKPPKPVDLEMR